jgi:hypothetical protein
MTQEKQNDAIEAWGLLQDYISDLRYCLYDEYENLVLSEDKFDFINDGKSEIFKTIRTELERAQRMQEALENIICDREVLGAKGVYEIAKQALSDAPTIKPQYGEWLPIETAPKDGTEILAYLFEDYSPQPVSWIQAYQGWRSSVLDSFVMSTHWMPLPDAPKEGE